jgi:hypothetical protein
MSAASVVAPPALVIHKLLGERRLSFAQAAREVPGRGNGTCANAATVWRWHVNGVKAADGRRVRLEAVKCGASFWTSAEAIGRFFAALTEGREADRTPPQNDTRLGRRASASSRRLEQLGI